MSRYASRPASLHYSFGPGPLTTAVKWLIIANVVMFVATLAYPPIIQYLGLSPELVIERQWFWQLATYLFLHGGAVHILLNMLGIKRPDTAPSASETGVAPRSDRPLADAFDAFARREGLRTAPEEGGGEPLADLLAELDPEFVIEQVDD